MRALFPKMRECPEAKHIALGGAYWVVYQIVLPYILRLFCAGLDPRSSVTVTCAAASILLNLIGVLVIFRSYLQDAFWIVRLDMKRLFTAVGLGVAVLAVLEVPYFIAGILSDIPFLFYALPMADPVLGIPSVALLILNPVVFGICVIFLVPVTMCCLYYAVGFAAPAQERPWLGYLIVALMAAVTALLLYTSGAYELTEAVQHFISVLPFHMCACWVYQRSDTIWGPIFFHAIVNVLSLPVGVVSLIGSAIGSFF